MTRESSMAKLFASETAVRAADDCVQIHGGYGFVKDYPAEKYFRDVKLLHHRRGHERDPAARHRPPAARRSDDRSARRWRDRRALADRVRHGDTRALARAISLVEDESPAGADLIRQIFAQHRPRVSASASPVRPAPARARSSIG